MKVLRILGWILLVGWIVYSVPTRWAHILKMVFQSPETGIPYMIGWILVLVLAIWLIRRKSKKVKESTK